MQISMWSSYLFEMSLRSLYSPDLMGTQIKAIEEKLMSMQYFGE